MKKTTKKKQKKFHIAKNKYSYNINDVYAAQSTVTEGRGVFAAKEFQAGDIIEVSPCIKVDKNPSALYYTNLIDYVFSNSSKDFNDDEGYIGLGYTSLYNHAHVPNADYDVMDDTIIITANRTIQIGEEIFIDYGWEIDRLDF